MHIIKNNKQLIYIFLAAFWGVYATSCSKIDEFRNQYLQGGEIINVGKADSLFVLEGDHRAGIIALLKDPKIKKLKIYWNNRTDSLEFPIQITAVTRDTFYINNLAEGIISFELRTYDDYGNVSVPVYITSPVRGDNYRASLLNRTISLVKVDSTNLKISWKQPDTVNVYTKLFYTDINGMSQVYTVSPDSSETNINDYRNDGRAYYQSFYKPNRHAMDTFASGHIDSLSRAVTDVTFKYFRNYSQPFKFDPNSGNGRFRNLVDWIVTPNVLNDNGANVPGGAKVGGWEIGEYNPVQWATYICMEAGWAGKSAIYDGKIYQTMTLPAGLYTFATSTMGKKDNLGAAKVYVVVAAGSVPPNTDDVPANSIAYKELYNDNPISFILPQQTTVSIGFVSTIPDGTNLEWTVGSMSLVKK